MTKTWSTAADWDAGTDFRTVHDTRATRSDSDIRLHYAPEWVPQGANLRGLWLLSENSPTTVTNYGGNGSDGTPSGIAAYQVGSFLGPGGFDFGTTDGSGEVDHGAESGSPVDFSNEVSIAVGARYNADASNQSFFVRRGPDSECSYGFQLNSNGDMEYYNSNPNGNFTTGTQTTSLTGGNTYLFGCSYKSDDSSANYGRCRFYLNGSFLGEQDGLIQDAVTGAISTKTGINQARDGYKDVIYFVLLWNGDLNDSDHSKLWQATFDGLHRTSKK